MTRPAITDMTVEELRGAARVLRDVLAATTTITEAAGVRAMLGMVAAIADGIIENAEAEEDEAAQTGLADAVADHLAQDGSSSPAASRVAPSAPAPESGQLTWTEERKQLLRERYPEGDHEEDLLAALNALPGIAVSSGLAVHRQATKMGLKRLKRAKYRYSPEGLASMRAAAERARAARAEAQPVVSAPAEDGNPEMEPSTEAEARAMLASGHGARALADEFGGSLDWWQAWCERERQAVGREA